MQLLGGLGGLLFGGAARLLGLGGKKQVAAQPVATRDDAAAAVARDDALRRRQGSVADMIVSGSAGATPGMVGKMVLGS